VNVTYDIAELGRGFYRPLQRTGFFRVVESVADGLAASPDCQLRFSAAESFETLNACLDYLQTRPHLSSIPVSVPELMRVKRWLYAQLCELRRGVATGPELARLARAGRLLETARQLKLGRRSLARLVQLASLSVDRRPDSRDYLAAQETDVFHSPADPLPPQIRSAVRFLTIYDLIPISHPEFCVPTQHRFMRETLGSLSPGDWVIAISQATKDDLCERTGMDPGRVIVTHLAADETLFYECTDPTQIDRARQIYGIPEGPYFLALGTLQPRKNVEHVIRCFAALVRQRELKGVSLVLSGVKGWQYDGIFQSLGESGPLANRVVFTGYVADGDLAALYSGALAFVMPSLAEGFGLPVLEAMQCGTPVITSNTSSLPEVVGGAGILLDPRDPDVLCQSMLDIHRQPSMRDALGRRALHRAKQFSWQKCTNETIAAYKAALAVAEPRGHLRRPFLVPRAPSTHLRDVSSAGDGRAATVSEPNPALTAGSTGRH
jgi:glycosyltransferase involved in cell wall biosynthesis